MERRMRLPDGTEDDTNTLCVELSSSLCASFVFFFVLCWQKRENVTQCFTGYSILEVNLSTRCAIVKSLKKVLCLLSSPFIDTVYVKIIQAKYGVHNLSIQCAAERWVSELFELCSTIEISRSFFLMELITGTRMGLCDSVLNWTLSHTKTSWRKRHTIESFSNVSWTVRSLVYTGIHTIVHLLRCKRVRVELDKLGWKKPSACG